MVVCMVRQFPTFSKADAFCKSFYRSCYETPAEIAPSFRISSLRCKLVYLTCALSRTTKNFFES